MARQFFAFCVSAALAGCAATTLTPLDPTHPASPEAAEAPVPPPSTTLSQTSGPAPGTSQSSSQSAAQRVAVYTCPMHPEVRRRAPGHCPKCGMELVPADESRGSGHAH
jgi:hypothetical protein